MKKPALVIIAVLVIVLFAAAVLLRNEKAQQTLGTIITSHNLGDAVDSLNGVRVFYNGAVGHTGIRHLAGDGYNYGLQWQCVEFVKRYYHDYLHHKMPDSYGNAKDFFDAGLADGELNKKRNLMQYQNGSHTTPKVNDLLVFGPTRFNKYGHVAIVSKADTTQIELIQQNPGPTAPSRVTYKVEHNNGKWTIMRGDLLGWLRKEP